MLQLILDKSRVMESAIVHYNNITRSQYWCAIQILINDFSYGKTDGRTDIMNTIYLPLSYSQFKTSFQNLNLRYNFVVGGPVANRLIFFLIGNYWIYIVHKILWFLWGEPYSISAAIALGIWKETFWVCWYNNILANQVNQDERFKCPTGDSAMVDWSPID